MNCHISRTSDDDDMKLGPVTKLDKRNKTTLKKVDDDVIVIFLVCWEFGAIRKLDSGRLVCKTCIFINSNLFVLQKLETELKNL